MPRRKNAAVIDKEEEKYTYQASEDLLTIHEVAHRLRVDDTTVRRWINNGVLDAVTLPHLGKRRGYRVKKATLDTLLSASTLTNLSSEE